MSDVAVTDRIEVIHPGPDGVPSSLHPPVYRCPCGLDHHSPDMARGCRHRLRPVPVMPESHNDQLTLEVLTDAR